MIIIRLTSNNELSEVDGPIDADGLVTQLGQREQIVRCAQRIAAYFEKEFGCAIPRDDFQQILLLLALSVERCDFDELSREKLSSIIDREFVDMVLGILDECGKRYDLPRFIDEPMRLQLVLHMFNAYQRAVYRVSYPKPLAAQIKSSTHRSTTWRSISPTASPPPWILRWAKTKSRLSPFISALTLRSSPHPTAPSPAQ